MKYPWQKQIGGIIQIIQGTRGEIYATNKRKIQPRINMDWHSDIEDIQNISTENNRIENISTENNRSTIIEKIQKKQKNIFKKKG